jgi:hypothetical protein
MSSLSISVILARLLLTSVLISAQILSSVFADEVAANTQAVSEQSPKCSDFLMEIKKKPSHLEFVTCKEVTSHGLAALLSEYRVAGTHAASVESHFVRTAKMPKLRYTCCGWESLPADPKTQRPNGQYQASTVSYEISMSSGETKGGSARSHWKEIPYFYVSVMRYLESP